MPADVVIVVLDTARAFDVTAGGADTLPGPSTTPVLDVLARESLVFPQATSTSCWTIPGHASLFTGLLPSEHHADEVSLRLGPEVPTLAAALRDAGYLTAGVSCNDLVSASTGLTAGFEHFVELRDLRRDRRREALSRARRTLRRDPADHGAEAATRVARSIIDETPRSRPLCLFVNYLEPHLPYQPPAAHTRGFLPEGETLARARGINQSPLDFAAGSLVHPPADLAALRALYRAAIHYNDRQVGRLLDALRRRGRFDDTLVVITSDHGENIGDHGLMDHQYSLHDTVLRVPLLVRVPGGAKTGRCDGLAQLTDVCTTVAEATGVPVAGGSGMSLLGAVDRDAAFAEYLPPRFLLTQLEQARPDVDWSRLDRGMRSIRTATRKYIAMSDGRDELYDLEVDPLETANLFGGHADEVTLSLRLRAHAAATRTPERGASEAPDVLDRLAALGYIE